nr:hypothetical protein GCM10020185_45950 [Pseudomonas brassicacearum subsp. brassicacearum]
MTQTQANSNYSALINAINGLGAVANTPLAESYYEVTRYFRGMAPYYNSTPTTYTSPIQYRCQKKTSAWSSPTVYPPMTGRFPPTTH